MYCNQTRTAIVLLALAPTIFNGMGTMTDIASYILLFNALSLLHLWKETFLLKTRVDVDVAAPHLCFKTVLAITALKKELHNDLGD